MSPDQLTKGSGDRLAYMAQANLPALSKTCRDEIYAKARTPLV
jgi:hypothetical protein